MKAYNLKRLLQQCYLIYVATGYTFIIRSLVSLIVVFLEYLYNPSNWLYCENYFSYSNGLLIILRVKDNKTIGINSITIFHQNICGLRKKTDELKSSMYPNFPHILCFSEHHLKNFELDQINVNGYNLGAT